MPWGRWRLSIFFVMKIRDGEVFPKGVHQSGHSFPVSSVPPLLGQHHCPILFETRALFYRFPGYELSSFLKSAEESPKSHPAYLQAHLVPHFPSSGHSPALLNPQTPLCLCVLSMTLSLPRVCIPPCLSMAAPLKRLPQHSGSLEGNPLYENDLFLSLPSSKFISPSKARAES